MHAETVRQLMSALSSYPANVPGILPVYTSPHPAPRILPHSLVDRYMKVNTWYLL